jgi:hypothetical protein
MIRDRLVAKRIGKLDAFAPGDIRRIFSAVLEGL